MEKLIYFDNAATTYPKPERVYEAMDNANRHLAVNAGRGSYRLAKKASSIIEETRKNILKIAGAEEVAEVVFTPSATLACNQVLGGIDWKKGDVVYVTPYEHNAVMRVLYLLQQQYEIEIEELAIEAETLRMDVKKIRYQFSKRPPSVVVMSHVSNVTGYIIPWQIIAKEAEQYGAVVVVDGSQGLGLVPVQLRNTAVDFYIFAGHKTLYGPLGVGGYINNREKILKHLLAGGTGSDSLNLEMPDTIAGYEPGSQNIVAIAGLLAATEEIVAKSEGEQKLKLEKNLEAEKNLKLGKNLEAEKNLKLGKNLKVGWKLKVEQNLKLEQELCCYLTERLRGIAGVVLYPPISMNDLETEQKTGILAMNIEEYKAADVGVILDEDYNIAVRTGYHCAPLIHKYLKDEEYAGVVRISLGRFNTKEEIDYLVKAVEEIAAGW